MNKTIVTIIFVCLFSFALFTRAVNAEPLPVYFLAQLEITDKDKFFKEYVPEVKKHLEKGKAEIIFGGFEPLERLEGDWGSTWTIAIKFPSKADFDLFYRSKGNLDIAIPIRYQSTSSNKVVLFEEFKK